jgi:hypothetical protein
MSDFGFYFKLGWEHIISIGALDHQLFILALAAIYLLKDWKQVLILVTAFTIGHSITLALSVFDIIRFSAKWVEFLIPCTIVFTAIINLFQKSFTPRSVSYKLFPGFVLWIGTRNGFCKQYSFYACFGSIDRWGLFDLILGLEVGQIAVVLRHPLFSTILVALFKVNRRDVGDICVRRNFWGCLEGWRWRRIPVVIEVLCCQK